MGPRGGDTAGLRAPGADFDVWGVRAGQLTQLHPASGSRGPGGIEPLDGLGFLLCSKPPLQGSGARALVRDHRCLGETGCSRPPTPARLGPDSDLGRGSPAPVCRPLLAQVSGGATVGAAALGRPAFLFALLPPCTFSGIADFTGAEGAGVLWSTPAPRPATSAGRKCAWVGAGWRISLGSASRTGGPGHSILSSRELLLFLYPVENGNFAKWDHPAAPQLGNSDSPFRYQDAVRCAGILGPLAGLTSHRWRGPDQFLSCAQDPL